MPRKQRDTDVAWQRLAAAHRLGRSVSRGRLDTGPVSKWTRPFEFLTTSGAQPSRVDIRSAAASYAGVSEPSRSGRSAAKPAGIEAAPPARPRSRVLTAIPWAILAAGLLLAFAVRVRLLDLPLERDEGEYAFAGQLISQGHVPYGEMDNMKLPGTYYAYALVMAIFGQTSRGIHLGLALWTTASALLLFAIGRRLLDPLAGAVAAASFAILSASLSVFGLAGHATHFVVLPALAGCWGILWPGRRERLALVLAGLAFGVAFLMKQQAAALMLFGLLYTLWTSRVHGFRSAASRGGLFAMGAVAPYAVLCVYLAAAGVFPNFWFWTVAYARDYVSSVPLTQAFELLREHATQAIGPNAPVWALAATGAVLFFARHRDRDAKVFLAGLLLFSFLAVCPGFFFRPHYFIVMLPAVSLLAGAGAASLASRRTNGGNLAGLAWALAAVLALSFAVAAQRAPFFQWDTATISRARYGRNPFPESIEIARYIAANSSPDDRIAVLGSEPQLYFYAHRRAATRYVYAYALMEPHPHAGQLQDQVIREIEAARPLFAVFVDVPTSWLARPTSDRRIQRWMSSYLPAHYETVGVIEIPPDGPTRYVWGEEAARTQVTEPYVVLVLRHRDGGQQRGS